MSTVEIKPWPDVSIRTETYSGKPHLEWAPVEGATAYEIWRSYSENGTYYRQWTMEKASYTNSSAKPGYTYYYKVKALTEEPQESSVVYVTCDCAAPTVKLTLHPVSGKPLLSWDDVEGAALYELWCAGSKAGEYTKLWSGAGTAYTHSSVKPGYTYYYKVKALCAKSNFGDSHYSKISYITADCATPKATLTINEETGRPTLTWESVAGAEKYEIHRAASKDGAFMKIWAVEGTSYPIPTLDEERVYYKVKALCAKSSYGDSQLSAPVCTLEEENAEPVEEAAQAEEVTVALDAPVIGAQVAVEEPVEEVEAEELEEVLADLNPAEV